MITHLFIYRTHEEARERFREFLKNNKVDVARKISLEIEVNNERYIYGFAGHTDDSYRYLGYLVNDIKYGVDVPQQVKDYLNHRLLNR